MSNDYLSDENIQALLKSREVDGRLVRLIEEHAEWKRRALAAEKDAKESNRQRDEAKELLSATRIYLEMAATHLDDAVYLARLHGGGAVWRKGAELLRAMAERCRKAAA